MPKNPKIILLFHKDLRTTDHGGIHAALEAHPDCHIIPIFIFTPEQVDSGKNVFKSANSVRFMIECLEELTEQTADTLTLFYGQTLDILQSLVAKLLPDLAGIVETADYTPYALKRQQEVRGLCALNSLTYYLIEDCYLTPPGSVLNAQRRMFQKFTPFWESARRRQVARPLPAPRRQVWERAPGLGGVATISLAEARRRFIDPASRLGESVRRGGRREATRLLSNLPENYDTTRDMLAHETSRLSAHNHYGTVSIREVYWTAKDSHGKKLDEFVRQLYWRDFYGHICYAFDTLYGVNPYDFWTEADPDPKRRTKATGAAYSDPKIRQAFESWKRGETGEDLVDAGMKQLLVEGFIHNRARLVVADYLVKGLGVPWRWGERWFAQHLVDYDFAQNFGNWCWVASVLPFSQAPFRRHVPERIQKRLDPGLEYTERWLDQIEDADTDADTDAGEDLGAK
jgi:deoxyribodipyrimidine photo-lyase